MTYCVGLRLNRGIIFASDTRTNAGFDNIACFRKMFIWENKGDRVLVLLTAGNLSVAQSVVSILNEELAGAAEHDRHTLMNAATMFQAARVVGAALREVHRTNGEQFGPEAAAFSASFILGGQIRGEAPRLFQIYNEGNFIEATQDTPFFQIGEHKYGKPILDRVAVAEMRMGDAAKLLLISFDSTLRSNLSVGMPIDMLIYRTDTYEVGEERRIGADDPYFRSLSTGWSEALRHAFANIESYTNGD
ncbi:MAG: peptidase [Alphaproteobacteria bacterium]|nr:MAG: peptidase [Alphaproteobacteria bacterium]